MLNIGVVFGGVSCEHDISIITAMQVINNLNKNSYNVFPIYIDKQGSWFYNKKFTAIENVISNDIQSCRCVIFPNDNTLYKCGKYIHKVIERIDVLIVAMHGMNGEDGMVSAIAKMANIKCISPHMLPSSLALDKCAFKKYLKGLSNIDVVDSLVYIEGQDIDKLKIEMKRKGINYPIILKPSRLGSSIGISVCNNELELEQKINYCLRFDSQVLIEKKLSNFKEYNIALFKSRKGIIVSQIEQPINKDEILSYSDKYLKNTKTVRGLNTAKRIFPAKIRESLRNKIETISKRVYESLDLSGVVRFDFLFDVDSKTLYLNELNTIPGSFAYYLFDKLTFSELLDELINYKYFMEQNKKDKIQYFASSVLKHGSRGIKK